MPFAQVARDLGADKMKNIVALGAFSGATQFFPRASFLTAISDALHHKPASIQLSEQAFDRGVQYASGQVPADAPHRGSPQRGG